MRGAGNDCRHDARERIRADRASRRRGRRAGARRPPFHRVPARPVRRFYRRQRFVPPTDNRHRPSYAVHLWGSARHHLSGPVTLPASRQHHFDGVCIRPVTRGFSEARSSRALSTRRKNCALRRCAASSPVTLTPDPFTPFSSFSMPTASCENARTVCHDTPPATDDECRCIRARERNLVDLACVPRKVAAAREWALGAVRRHHLCPCVYRPQRGDARTVTHTQGEVAWNR